MNMLSDKKYKKVFCFLIGSISLFIGILGIFLPILPTTPFILLTAACYARSSEKAHNWLMNNRIFGRIISDYKNKQGVPLKIKIYVISLLWITISISALLLINIFLIKILLFIIAISVTIHILRFKTKK